MGWLIALAVVVLLGCLPLGVRGIYNESGATVDLLIGLVKKRIFPGKKKEKTEKPKQKEKKSGTKTKKPETDEKKGGSFTDFLPLVKIAGDFLGDLRRKLRIKRLEMYLCMAGGEPCDLAINYGRAWAAVGNLMPLLERLFVIKKRDIQVACDFTQSQTTIYVRGDITITLGRLLGLLVRYGWRAIRQYLKITNKGKGGAE